MKKNVLSFVSWVFLALFIITVWVGAGHAQTLTLGKTYDKSNYQEIEKLLVPQVLNWVKKGQFIIGTKKLEFDPTYDSVFIEGSKKNEGKYDISPDGFLLDKATGQAATYFFGFPFPSIDSKDPKAATKIMENNTATRFRNGGSLGVSTLLWVGQRGVERQVTVNGKFFYYVNRVRGPVANPERMLGKQIIFVSEPFDLKGTVQMTWLYNDARPDSSFAYVPALRRVRRVSASTRSDPYLGSDLSLDDLGGWGGKNQTMNWKLVGEGTYLLPFGSEKLIKTRDFPDGSYERQIVYVKKGYDVKGFAGAPWCPVGWAWSPREVYILEVTPKDPYYNSGKMLIYVDKKTFVVHFKVVYNKSGEYWKTLATSYVYQETPSGKNTTGIVDFFLSIDDKTNHASVGDAAHWEGIIDRQDLPLKELNEGDFTEAALRQLSK